MHLPTHGHLRFEGRSTGGFGTDLFAFKPGNLSVCVPGMNYFNSCNINFMNFPRKPF